MPKRKPTRSMRRRQSRPPASLPTRPDPSAPRHIGERFPTAAAPAAPAPRAPARRPERERDREPSITRFSPRDYTYVSRELQRIVLLASAILITIIVLSFFIP